MYRKVTIEEESLLPKEKVSSQNRLRYLFLSMLAFACIVAIGIAIQPEHKAEQSVSLTSTKLDEIQLSMEQTDHIPEAEIPVGPGELIVSGDAHQKMYDITLALIQGSAPFRKTFGKADTGIDPRKTIDGRFQQIAGLVQSGDIPPEVAEALTGSPEGEIQGYHVAFHFFWGAEERNVGHTSMYIPTDGNVPGQYVSFWPKKSENAGAIGSTESTQKSFAQDRAAEGNKDPDMIVMNLVTPDQCTQMLEKWEADKNKEFALTCGRSGSNCSSMVYEILKAANIDLKEALNLNPAKEAVLGRMMAQWRPSWIFEALITATLQAGSGWIRNPGRECCDLQRLFLDVNVAAVELSPEFKEGVKKKIDDIMSRIPACVCGAGSGVSVPEKRSNGN